MPADPQSPADVELWEDWLHREIVKQKTGIDALGFEQLRKLKAILVAMEFDEVMIVPGCEDVVRRVIEESWARDVARRVMK